VDGGFEITCAIMWHFWGSVGSPPKSKTPCKMFNTPSFWVRRSESRVPQAA